MEREKYYEVAIHTLPHLKCVQVTSHLECVRLFFVRSSLRCTNIGVRIELTSILIQAALSSNHILLFSWWS